MSHRLTLVARSVIVVLVAAPFARADQATAEFTNGHNVPVSSLHVEWSRAVHVTAINPFGNTGGSGTNVTEFSNGTVNPGGTATLTLTWDGGAPKVKRWWWANGKGTKVGDRYEGGVSLITVEVARGLYTATYETDHGKILVNLPDDVAAGDTVSGTVVTEPAGALAEDRQRNRGQLNACAVEVAGDGRPASAGAAKWEIPGAAAKTATLVFRRPDGSRGGAVQLPIRPAPTGDKPSSSLRSGGSVQLPTLGQTSRAIQIPGTFDGDFQNLSVVVGGREGRLVAESPRKAVVEGPIDVVGPTRIRVRQGDLVAEGEFRSITISLMAGKTTLNRGEKTVMTAEVTGLAGLREPVQVLLRNTAPGIVAMQGGDTQTVAVGPGGVDARGVYRTERTLTGIGVGGFGVVAEITPVPANRVALVPCAPQADTRPEPDERPKRQGRAEPPRPGIIFVDGVGWMEGYIDDHGIIRNPAGGRTFTRPVPSPSPSPLPPSPPPPPGGHPGTGSTGGVPPTVDNPPRPTPPTPTPTPTTAPPTPTPTRTPTPSPTPRKGCCCCVDNLELKYTGGVVVEATTTTKVVDPDVDDPVEMERVVGPQFGHEFKLFITYHNKRVADANEVPGDCILRWLEKSDRPPASNARAGVKPDAWADIGETVGGRYPGLFKNGTLGPWARHEKTCPLPPKRIELTDKPAIFYGKSRTMYFHIIVESAPGCTCANKMKEVWAKQVLEEGPSDKKTKFYPNAHE